MKRRVAFVLLIVLTCTHVIRSSNILIFAPSPYKSHVVSFQPFFLELAHRGHNLTVVTQFPIRNPPINYTQVVIKHEVELWPYANPSVERNKYLFLFEGLRVRYDTLVDWTHKFVSNRDLQKFIVEDRSTFDLVVVESFFQECTVAIGHKYGAPVVGFIPLAPWISPSLHAANPTDFSHVKDYLLNVGKSLDFENRLLNTFCGLYSILIEQISYYPRMANLMNTYFQYPGYETRPTMAEMLRNMSLSLVDSDVMTLSPRPYVPSFVEVPGINLQHTNQMSEKLKYFMDDAHAGVVYISFGTVVSLDKISDRIINDMFNVLGRLEQKVVLKWNDNGTRELPENFFVDSWLPQFEILKHPNCKLFVTHGGLHGLMETVFAGVPIIGFPIFADQFQNIKISQENGFGIESNLMRLNEETFEKDLKLILNDRRFTENAKRMSSIFRDRPMKTLDKAVYWVEYVIRHKGTHHLRSSAVDLTWYQHALLDVFSFVSFTIILFVVMCLLCTKWTVEVVHGLLSKQTKTKQS